VTPPDPVLRTAPASPPPASGSPRPGGRSRRLVRVALIIVTVVLMVDAIVGENGVLALLQARRQFAAVERALQQSREDNGALREAGARRDLNLIKPGEKVFIVKDATPRP
jgi:cell division protein FtsB